MLKKIFTPYRIGNMEVPNRLVVSAMVTNYAQVDGKVTERFIRYHEEKAKGGWGLIIPENYAVVHRGKSYMNIPGIWEDAQIPGHKEFTDRIHTHGSKVVAQIFHAGRQTAPAFIGGLAPQSASAVPCPAMQQKTEALTNAEVYELIEAFGDAALRAKMAGYDGVEVHGAHGYLIAQFLSPYANKRTDEFGGHLYNRVRFASEIIKNIKKKAGNKFPILFRISGDELVEGGLTIEDVTAIATILEDVGIDAIHISAGNYQASYGIIPPMYVPHAWITDLADKVKKVVDIPVITVGRINDPFYAEATLKAGKADFIAMARASLADPYLPNKTAAGAYDDILRCIGCVQGCPFTGQPMRCVVNPTLGREYEFDLTPAAAAKKVMIVGGGIAGCEAAIYAARKGHDVTIYEKSGDLGGQFSLAAVPPGKIEISSFIFWQKNQLKKLGVNVVLNHDIAAEEILKQNPDAVIVATGSVPFAPPIKGLEKANVIDSHEYLAGKATAAGSKILVVGGGMVGAETAHMLCTYNKAVTMVDMLPEMAASMQKNIRNNLFGALKKYGAQLYVNTAVKEVTDNGVIVTVDGVEKNLGNFDTIVMACGVKANNILEEKLVGKVEVYSAGDAVQARTALEAIKEGFEAAMKL